VEYAANTVDFMLSPWHQNYSVGWYAFVFSSFQEILSSALAGNYHPPQTIQVHPADPVPHLSKTFLPIIDFYTKFTAVFSGHCALQSLHD
jgi:hypothetical protein